MSSNPQSVVVGFSLPKQKQRSQTLYPLRQLVSQYFIFQGRGLECAGDSKTHAQKPRQYKKHVGRNLEVITLDSQNLEGELTEVNEEGVVLTWKTREPKPVGKGKVTVTKEANVTFENIKEAKVKIKF